MNTMSVSPVKPPLNPATLAVPSATATNLSKSALPSNNSFGALNLVPEGKGTAPVPAAPSTPEKLVDSPAKVALSTPTSNGSVSPLPDTGQSAPVPAAVPSIQNCNEKNELTQNLSTNNTALKIENTVEEPPKVKVDVDKKKEEKKVNADTKGSSSDNKSGYLLCAEEQLFQFLDEHSHHLVFDSSVLATSINKDVTAQIVSTNETPSTPSSTEISSVKKDAVDGKKKEEKIPEATSLPSESVPVETAASSPAKKEASVEPTSTKVVPEEKKPVPSTKEESVSAKTEAEPITKKKVEPAHVKTESPPKTASPPKATKRKAKVRRYSILNFGYLARTCVFFAYRCVPLFIGTCRVDSRRREHRRSQIETHTLTDTTVSKSHSRITVDRQIEYARESLDDSDRQNHSVLQVSIYAQSRIWKSGSCTDSVPSIRSVAEMNS